jgi:hypothetical protein
MSDEDTGIDVTLEEPKKADESLPDVEIVDEKPSKKAGKYEISPEEGISELKKNLEREKQARLEAEQRAQQAFKQAQKMKVDKTDSDYQLVVNAIETVKGRNEQLKSAYAEAMNVQDFARAAEIQSAMNQNAQQLSELKRGKKAMKEQIKEAKSEAKAPLPPQGDLVDQLASTVSPRSASWLRDSREHLKTERDIRKMFRAHEDAIDDGISPDTDEYFSYIESRLGIRKDAEQSEERAAPVQRKPVQPSPAPVSRGSSRPNVMRLTAAEAETASALGMTPEEYAKNKSLLQKEGRYGH